MSQQVVYQDSQGIVLASDSRVMYIDGEAWQVAPSQKKIYSLGPDACISSVGEAVGVTLSQQFQERVRERGWTELLDIYAAAHDFLNRRYYRYLLQHYGWFRTHPGAFRLLYFVIAGYSRRLGEGKVFLLESKDHELPFTLVPIGHVVTMPRVLTLEARLVALQKRGASLEEVAAFCLEQMQLIARRDATVGGPYQVVVITASGVRFVEDW